MYILENNLSVFFDFCGDWCAVCLLSVMKVYMVIRSTTHSVVIVFAR